MRTIRTEDITQVVKKMCIEANLYLADDMKKALFNACDNEENVLGKKILGQLKENLDIAGNEQIPICQDTGMAVVFVKIGQDVHIEGGSFSAAINEGVRQGYTEGYLRKSVVNDPIVRKNTGDNTPAIIHTEIVDGDSLEITLAPKGFGSENMSRIFMLKPADGIDGIKNAVLTAVKDAGPNACPPVVVGVGIGGDFEKSALLAKKALTNELNSVSSYFDEVSNEYAIKLQKDLYDDINNLDIGPGGMGGKFTCLGVNLEIYPTHIAGMPLAVNMCCHVNRHVKTVL
ncbi:MAG: fumarate hydratase [Lachnospiraceae bacterium]|nr:fumarate hydratase [Lachnospiraceae bacterium]MBR4542147.1 fumarate hydratase [Lachnospiraceae bacterium]